jgi:hypothetical protein
MFGYQQYVHDYRDRGGDAQLYRGWIEQFRCRKPLEHLCDVAAAAHETARVYDRGEHLHAVRQRHADARGAVRSVADELAVVIPVVPEQFCNVPAFVDDYRTGKLHGRGDELDWRRHAVAAGVGHVDHAAAGRRRLLLGFPCCY